MRLNFASLIDEVRSRGWIWAQDFDGWNISTPEVTASCINTKGPMSPESIPAEAYPRLYVNGRVDKVVELVQLVAACEEK
jgi:hypothetical protein